MLTKPAQPGKSEAIDSKKKNGDQDVAVERQGGVSAVLPLMLTECHLAHFVHHHLPGEARRHPEGLCSFHLWEHEPYS